MYCAWRGRLCEPIDLLARILESLPLVLILRSLSIKSFAIKTCHSPTQLYKKPSPSLLLFPLTHITLAFLTLHRREKMDSGGSKRTCFIEEDDGLASVADMEAGFSGNHSQNNNNNNNYALFSRPLSYARSSLKNLSTSSPSSVCFSPRSGGARFYDARFEEQLPHFLDACFLCKKPLGNRDIYMYRSGVVFNIFISANKGVIFFRFNINRLDPRSQLAVEVQIFD